MKIKELTFAIKKGLPNYSSVSAGMSVTVEEGEDLDKAWDSMKQECINQCNEDSSWINKDSEIVKDQREKIPKYKEAKGVNRQ